ncbi:hypothetical protein IMY05_001G0174200 [Salix suchowensis]|nr:hypothetical protein IMY05_001G0174200 [Salix suchowensis]
MGKKLSKIENKNQGHITSHGVICVLDLLRHRTINIMQTLINKLSKKKKSSSVLGSVWQFLAGNQLPSDP